MHAVADGGGQGIDDPSLFEHVVGTGSERVRALVAVGPVGIAPFTETATAALAASTTNSSLDAAEAKLRRVLYRRELIDAAWIAEEHAFAARSADGDGLAGLRTYLHPPDRVNSDVVTGWLDDLGTTMPTLVICGEQDRIVDVAAIEAAVSAMPHVRYAAVPEAGHLPYVERPEQFDAILHLDGYYDSQPSRTRFELQYALEDDAWRLIEIDVQVR